MRGVDTAFHVALVAYVHPLRDRPMRPFPSNAMWMTYFATIIDRSIPGHARGSPNPASSFFVSYNVHCQLYICILQFSQADAMWMALRWETPMPKVRYCECGSKIVVRIRGRATLPKDNDHSLCERCWHTMTAMAIVKEYRQWERDKDAD